MPTADGQPQTQGERRANAEAALLDAAARLTAAHGIDHTSLAEIGEAAGYSRGLANHHFGTKEALVQRLVDRTGSEVVALLPDSETATLAETIDMYLDLVAKDEWWARAFMALWGAAVPTSAPLREIMADRDQRLRTRIAAVARSDQERGLIRPELDPDALAVTVVGMIRGIATQLFVDGSVDIDSARHMSVALVESLAPAAETIATEDRT